MSEKKTFIIEGNDLSDGYHTFDELYEHRMLLYINFCLSRANECYWTFHEDFGNCPICLVWESRAGQISYHLNKKYLSLIQKKFKRNDDHKYDGHNSFDVLDRLKVLSGGEL